MVKIFTYSLLFATVWLTACNNENPQGQKPQSELVFPKGKKVVNENFTGTVYLQMLMDADSLNSISVGNVTFEPGARSKWHSHPAGQILLVIDGVGYYQEEGQPKKYYEKEKRLNVPPMFRTGMAQAWMLLLFR